MIPATRWEPAEYDVEVDETPINRFNLAGEICHILIDNRLNNDIGPIKEPEIVEEVFDK